MRRILASIALLASLAAHPAAAQPISAIGIENQYADVIAQIGGPYVTVTSIVSDPNTDPHSFEASPRIAAQIAAAGLIVENGLGYDDWAGRMIAATPNAKRQIIIARDLLGLPDPNPHLWYNPSTMPAVAAAIAAALARLDPAHAKFFQANEAAFTASLTPWTAAIIAFRHAHPNIPVAVTEPVGDDLLAAMGARILTPSTLESAIMNGTDPAPQDVTTEESLLTQHGVRLFVYNQQVTDPLTQTFLALARANHIPIVGVYETMPAPGYTYQSWMLAETQALIKAVTQGTSTETLLPAPNP
jgi:zinc/manganese transport system substrate-binding protein